MSLRLYEAKESVFLGNIPIQTLFPKTSRHAGLPDTTVDGLAQLMACKIQINTFSYVFHQAFNFTDKSKPGRLNSIHITMNKVKIDVNRSVYKEVTYISKCRFRLLPTAL